MPFQIFVSYARLDDVAPPGSAEGFVTMFVRQLEWDLKQRKPGAEIWRDKDGRICPSDQFEDVIQRGISESQVLVVVLSDNWLSREYCRKELEWFAHTHGPSANRSIIVVAKHELDPGVRPQLLQGQTGYRFYDEETPGKPEYFTRGKAYADQLLLVIEDIARDIRERAVAFDPTARREAAPPAAVRERRVYVAKPASDMKLAYIGLLDELTTNGYTVTPARDAEIPLESTAAATEFIDAGLDDVEASIHLLGEKPGLATDDENAAPIVKLQLARAATFVRDGSDFRRLIWAPEALPNQTHADGAAPRYPLTVLERFGAQASGDEVQGGGASEFNAYVIQHLSRRSSRSSDPIEDLGSDSRVYVYHRREDEDYALTVAEVLKRHKLQPVLPIFDDTDAEINAWHRQQLAECDAVVVCWADAGEVWVRQQTPEWKDWRKLGREREFTCSGVIAGPPGDRKQSYLKKYSLKLLSPREQVDIVLDLTAYQVPPENALDPLVRAATLREKRGA